jgi:NAD(P)-dependent dehydrogenase (short-subunit alcohol dehydrogenase family)
VLGDLNAELGEAVAGRIGERALYVPMDVTEEISVHAALEKAAKQFGRVNVVVNCAGIGAARRMLGRDGPMKLDQFRRVVEINLIGTFNVSRLAAEVMASNEAEERGVVVHTASIAAYDGQIGQCAYAASKGGIVGLTLPMARELAQFGIRVVAIAPGLFDTPLLAGLPAEARQALETAIPYPPRLGNPEEFAALVCHIIENPYLNGEVVRLDGALRMGPK